MRVRVLRVVDDPAYKGSEADDEDGRVCVVAGEQLGKDAVKLLNESRHAARNSEKAEVTRVACAALR